MPVLDTVAELPCQRPVARLPLERSRMDSRHRENLVERYFPHVSHQVVLFYTDSEIDRHHHSRLVDLGVVDHALQVGKFTLPTSPSDPDG